MSKRFIITIITLAAIAVIAAVAIFLAKGYTFSPKEKRIVGTGIITVSSEPDAASVFIDGHLTTATNATIPSLAPKDYAVKVIKDGFIPWEKQISVKEGLVTEVKVVLFPAIPTIYPLTFSGVKSLVLSPDGGKLAYIVPDKQGSSLSKKAGIWVWTQVRNQPISFVRSSEPHQISQNLTVDFSQAVLKWSADSKQILATVGPNSYLLDADKLNSDPRDITLVLPSTLQSWEEDRQNKDESRIMAISDARFRQIASSSAKLSSGSASPAIGGANLRFSPDETKFMVIQSSDKTSLKAEESAKVYDLEEKKEYDLPPAKSHIWLPDSRHVILIEEGTISVVDFDATNKAVIFAGSFQDDFVFPWLDSSRLVIISSSPTPTASEPNLYGINLK